MSPVRSHSRLSVALIAGVLLVGLLPATALAADPVADDDAYRVADTGTTALDVMENDTDADAGDTPEIVGVTTPAHGTAVINAGKIDYTPTGGYHGPDSFDYTIEDDTAGQDTATVTITVNTPPVANDDPTLPCQDPSFFGGGFPMLEDYDSPGPPADYAVLMGTCAPLGNDTDADGDTLTWEVVTQPANGHVIVVAPDFVGYRPDPDYSSGQGYDLDPFTYRAFDGLQYSAPATMSFWVAPINDAPSFTSGGNVTVIQDSGAYSAAWATNVSPGPASESWQTVQFEVEVDHNGVPDLFAVEPAIADDGTLTFTPAAGEVGLVHVTVRAVDDGGLEDWDIPDQVPPDDTSDDVTFDLVVDLGPLDAVDDTTTVLEDVSPGPWLVDVLANDEVPAGYTVTGVTQGTLGDVSIASGGGAVLYAPHADANGSDSFTYTLSDGFGTEDTATVSVTVTSVNDAPSGANANIGVTENSSHTFTAGDFGFTDPNDSPADDLLAVKITTLPAAGSLTDDGNAVSAGDDIPVADITGGDLVFTPVGGATGSPYATIGFKVQDDGGTSDGGVDLDPSANTLTINVTPINHAPIGANKTVTTLEDAPYTLIAADFGFTDPNDTPANSLLAVKIATLPGAGTLRNNGATFAAGTSVSAADITANRLTFTPAANASGNPYTTFTFQVQDDGGTASGGVDLDQSANTITVNVTARNDAPSGTNKTVTTNEEVAYTLVQADFGFSDPSDSPANTFTAVRITTLPLVGPLRNNGVAVVAGSSIPIADIIANKLVFTPVLNGNGSPYASFTFQVQDNGGTANSGSDLDPSANTITVNVTPVQDPPDARTDASFTVPESAGPTALAVLANDIEVDGQAMSITGVTQPAHGVVAITGGGTGLSYDPTQLYFGTDSFTYTISDGNGGSDTATVLLTVVKDTVKPTVVGPAEKFYNQTVATKTSRVQIYWSGSDAGTGIKKYELAVSVSGGAFINLTLGSATATSLNITLTDEKSYKFRVRATDNQGNVSAWVNGPTFKPGRVQQNSTSVVYAGPWATVSTTSALGGSHRYASSLSARASLTRSVRDFALVMTKTSTSGMAEIRIDGVLAATINLKSTSTVYRQVVFTKHFGSLGTHTIEVRPIGGTRIYLDAFLVMR